MQRSWSGARSALFPNLKLSGETSMTVLIDSWTWIEYWKGGPYSTRSTRYIEGSEEAVVSTINLSEVYFWVMKYYDERLADQKISTMERRCYVIPVEREIALDAAKIKKKQGLALADSLILATARRMEASVVTGDADFRNVSNVIFLGK